MITTDYYTDEYQAWDDTNTDSPDDWSKHSSHIAIWSCPQGHHWRKSIAEWHRYPLCPYCDLLKRGDVHQGTNDVRTVYPDIESLWDYNRNQYPPQFYNYTSKSSVYIIGKDTPVRIRQFLKENGIDNNQRYHDVYHTRPDIAAFFDETSPISPHDISPYSRKEVILHCSQGHIWREKMRYFTMRQLQCPVCNHTLLQRGVNDLQSEYPLLSKELIDADPSDIMANSSKSYHWKCLKCQGIWECSPSSRTKRKHGKSSSCPYCSGNKVLKGYNDLLTARPDITNIWSTLNTCSPDEITAHSEYSCILQCKYEHTWTAPAYYITRPQRHGIAMSCPYCHPMHDSMTEKEIANVLRKYCPDIIVHDRKSISPQELDILIPEKKIAIEYNGLYWHSEKQGKQPLYHYNKWKQCKDNGIQLIQIWEDDWETHHDIVLSALFHKLSISHDEKIGARKTTISSIGNDTARDFLNAHHIQGYAKGCINIGLYDKQHHLVAVMSLRTTHTHGEKALLINRYATAINVQGGFTKLLSHCIRTSPDIHYIVSFSDNCISDGSLYAHNGFDMDKAIPPDYMYMVNGRRIHKFNYRKQRFRDDASLHYEDGLTERQLADANGLNRVWDAGKIRWIKKVNNK